MKFAAAAIVTMAFAYTVTALPAELAARTISALPTKASTAEETAGFGLRKAAISSMIIKYLYFLI